MRILMGCILTAALACVAYAAGEQAQALRGGTTSRILREELVGGHLADLNGRYKLRLTETVYEPGGWIGVHHHAGPGLRYVVSGALRYVEAGRDTTYRAGDCIYETGALQHTARNDGKVNVRLLNFEVLPADWKGASAYAVPDSMGH